MLTPGFNTDLVPKGSEPKTYDDLLDPKWKGKMAWSSLGSSSSANGFVGSVLTFMGQEKGTAYLQKLATQDIANVAAGARQVMDQVIAGEYPIALQTFNKHAVISAAQGAPAGWIPMLPMTLVLNVDSLTANSPHPNAGKLFLSFVLSQEGQELFRDTDYIPSDPKVPPRDPSLVPKDFNVGAVTLSPDDLDAAMPKWSALYRSMFK